MLRSIYTVFTTYEGVYIFYLVPIIYFIIIVFNVISSKRKLAKRIRIPDVMTVGAIGLITLDFIYYSYLFLTKTGKLLPPLLLLIKYTGGFFLWLWIFWYSYEAYFAPRVAGEHFKTRFTILIWICIGSLGLAFIGIIAS